MSETRGREENDIRVPFETFQIEMEKIELCQIRAEDGVHSHWSFEPLLFCHPLSLSRVE